MESKATAKFVRVSPRKTRLVARNVKGMPVEAATNLAQQLAVGAEQNPGRVDLYAEVAHPFAFGIQLQRQSGVIQPAVPGLEFCHGHFSQHTG